MAMNQPNQQHEHNFFDDFKSVPSLSWAEAAVGTVVKGTISKLPDLVHDREIGTKEPKYWKSGEPQMAVVLHVDITTAQGTVETRSVWAKKPSSMYRALGQAQKDAGATFVLGGTLYIRLERLEPSKTPGFNPQKIYVARYDPPATPDPWAGTVQPAQGTTAPPAPASAARMGHAPQPASSGTWATPTAPQAPEPRQEATTGKGWN